MASHPTKAVRAVKRMARTGKTFFTQRDLDELGVSSADLKSMGCT